jgi:hypothetical protein
MEYRIEPIGGQFSKKAVTELGANFTAQAKAGWKLHSVFQAQQPGCLGIGSPTITYFAIYVKE